MRENYLRIQSHVMCGYDACVHPPKESHGSFYAAVL